MRFTKGDGVKPKGSRRRNRYTSQFYETYRDESSRSAGAFAEYLRDNLALRSVIDVGCGIGTWARAFAEVAPESGVAFGVDGSYVDPAHLLIPESRFAAVDLSQPVTLPESFPKRFDLVISMEVGEHLPAEAADQYVETLTSLGPIVLFSAAIPRQGGTDHVNEQWQSYWAAKFAVRGYATLDCLRPALWGKESIAYYYAQNALLYVASDEVASVGDLATKEREAGPLLDKVHPRKWMEAHDDRNMPLRRALQAPVKAGLGAIQRRRASGAP